MEFEVVITLTMMACFVVLSYGIILIRQDIDEIKNIIKENNYGNN